MARHATEFQTIHSEGGLLPTDLLRRVLDPKEKLTGTKPEDYGLPQGERLNEIITQSWNRLRKHWAEFRFAVVNLHAGEAGTGLTNDKWSLPLLRELGFGLLPTSAGPEINGRSYAINRFFGPMPIHLVGCGVSLDRRAAGVRGAAAANPHSLVQEFLNRSPGHVWAIVSNGLRLRLLRDNQALSRQSFLEFDLEAMFVGEVYSDFVLLWLMAHATRFVPKKDNRAETCWLEEWTTFANERGARALRDLRGGVERALQILGEGFTGHPKNASLRDALRTGQVSPADFHGQLLRVVYRLIFLFVAEDRNIDGRSLLHPRDDSDAAQLARERYAAYYSMGRLRDMAAQIRGGRHGDLWRQFHLITGALSGQASSTVVREHLALPPLGSFLWDPAFTAALNDAELSNHDLLEALRNLAFARQGKALRPVDYKNLGAEELGGVYESLLALTPQISGDGHRFSFAEFAGNERKSSGSYYTPDSLVQCLLDSALNPVVEEAIEGKTSTEAEKAILALKICDPAVGSGHFLVGAAHRLARHLARVRALAHGESEPSPLLYQHALRDVIGHCLYGVDMNPMAAELCRISLWLEALEPGMPLSFLDHHIRVGNSLLGATPELIEGGIPDQAFTPIKGDDKKACALLKKRNKTERAGVGPLFAEQDAETQARLGQAAAALEELPDDRLEDIRAKELAFRRHEQTEEYHQKKLLADIWCAAFVIKKYFRIAGRDSSASGISQRHLNDLVAHRPLPADLAAEAERLVDQYQFFHWHLAFPEVFARGGFNCVLGNPPWERVKLQEREFFSASRPDIANAQTAAMRGKSIADLATDDPTLFATYHTALRRADAEGKFARATGRFPYGSVGDTNTYPLFLELAMDSLESGGRAGIIAKTGILADFTLRKFFDHLIEDDRLISAFDFSNAKSLFPDVVENERFSLLTLGGKGANGRLVAISILNEEVSDLQKQGKIWQLSRNDIRLINPNTHTCPLFQTEKDAHLVSNIYRRHPILVAEQEGGANSWQASYYTMFHMTNDSSLFRDLESLQSHSDNAPNTFWRTKEGEYIPLLEGKLFDLFDHRHGTFEGVPREARFGIKAEPNHPGDTQKQLADNLCLPRYWVRSREVSLRYADRLGFQPSAVLMFRDVCRTHTDLRTVRSCICPPVGAGNKAPLLLFPTENCAEHAVRSSLLCANLDSFALDYVARQKFSGGSLNRFIIVQFPIIARTIYDTACAWAGNGQAEITYLSFVTVRVLELSYTTWDLAAFAQDCGWVCPPFRWDEERRFLLRCELDAAFFQLYLPAEKSGNWRPVTSETAEDQARLKVNFPTPRDAVAYIMDTFPIVRRKDEETWGEYRTKRVILDIYDAMQESIRTGQSYRTRLDPPPGDPCCCHAPRETDTNG